MSVSFGEALPDQLSPLLSTSNAHLSLASDLAALLSERAALEREYAAKLQAIVRKGKERREKRLPEAVAGPEPARVCTQDEARGSSTLQTFITTFLATTESTASKAAELAENLEGAGADLANGSKKRGEVVRKHSAFAQKLLADRDRYYGERTKAKSKYDDACSELEAARAKKEKAEAEDKHVDKASKAHVEAQEGMEAAKNAYLISIVTANRAKATFYRAALPALQDHLQYLWTLSSGRIATGLVRASTHAAEHYEELGASERNVIASASSVNAEADQSVYVELNRRAGWSEPVDWAWEPAQGFFDTPEMKNESDAARVILQNRLLKARAKLDEHAPIIEAKRREAEGLERLRAAYEADPSLGDADAVMDNLLEAQREITSFELQVSVIEAEIDAIEDVIGHDASDARPHRFTPHSFTLPTSCGLCQHSAWGKQLLCKPCGYTCHAKCEAKVPARCRAGNAPSAHRRSASTVSKASTALGGGGGGALSRTTTGASVRSSMPPPRRGVPQPQPQPAATLAEVAPPAQTAVPSGHMLYAYEATTEGELSMQEGETFEVVQDDADGWLLIRKGASVGLVPTSYTQLTPSSTTAAPPGSGATQGCGMFVVALYDYAATGADELSLVEGERVELTVAGMSYGEGWAEGVKDGRKGVFPSAYVQTA